MQCVVKSMRYAEWSSDTSHIHTFTLKMHFPICALIFIWLVVLNVAAWQNQKWHKEKKAKKRNMKWENKVGKMQWKRAEGVNTICKWWGIFYPCFTVMLESFPLWWYRNPSSITTVLRVSEMSSWIKDGVPALAKSMGKYMRAHTKVTEVGFRTSLAHLWVLPMTEKTTKQAQSKHHTAEGTHLMQSIRKRAEHSWKN